MHWKSFTIGAVSAVSLIIGYTLLRSAWSYINWTPEQLVATDYCPELDRVPSDIEYLWAAYNNPNVGFGDARPDPPPFRQVVEQWILRETQKRDFGDKIFPELQMKSIGVELLRGRKQNALRSTGPLTYVFIPGWAEHIYIDRCLKFRDWLGD